MARLDKKRIPHYYAAGFEEINPDNLGLVGLGDVDLVVTDVDGVLRDYHANKIPASKKRAIEELTRHSIAVATFTNASPEIIEELRTDRMLGDVILAELIQGSFDRSEIKKPRGNGLIQFGERGFHHGLFIGDQIFSDVIAVNDANEILNKMRAGGDLSAGDFEILSVLLPMYGENDNFWVKSFRRAKEAKIKDRLQIPRDEINIPPGIFRVRQPL